MNVTTVTETTVLNLRRVRTIAVCPTFGMSYPDGVARGVGTSKSSRYRWEGIEFRIAIAHRAVQLVRDLVSSS